MSDTPLLDTRDAEALAQAIRQRLPSYVPGWLPAEGEAGWALIQIYARYMQALLERLNQMPDKNKLAFLDLLGITLIPAQAARVPVVFQMQANAGNSRAAVRTRLGAKVTGRSDPLSFETEKTIGLAAALLAEVVTVHPGLDSYASHSTAVIGGQQVTLFATLKPIPHEFYLAHNTYFALAGDVTVELHIELNRPGSQPMLIAWEYWDGEVWRDFKPFATTPQGDERWSVDGTQGMTRSGIIQLVADCGANKKSKVNGLEAYWIRGRLTEPIPPSDRSLPVVDTVETRTRLEHCFNSPCFFPDAAYAEGLKVDFAKPFYPFGQQPQPGSTLYFSSAEAFSKPGAVVQVASQGLTTAPTGLANPTLQLQYWNGSGWADLNAYSITAQVDMDKFGLSTLTFQFTVPNDLAPTRINDEEGLWMRLMMTADGYYVNRDIRYLRPKTGTTGSTPADLEAASLLIRETVPPLIGASSFQLGYSYTSPQQAVETAYTYNDFQWEDRTEDARWRGTAFQPFSWTADRTPTLYLGFDRALPADTVSLYFDILEVEPQGEPLQWEYWNGQGWLALAVEDETNHLALPGMVTALWPGVESPPAASTISAAGNTVQLMNSREALRFRVGDLLYIREGEKGELAVLAAISGSTLLLKTPLEQKYGQAVISRATLPRFGTPRTWIRARLQTGGDPRPIQLNGLYLNAVWASQTQTVEDELLGSSTGQVNQVYFFRQSPVLEGEIIEVRELEGARADVELPILQQEIQRQGLPADVIRLVRNPVTGRVSEVWVRWQQQPNLLFSRPDSRHYLIERSQGRLIFGDNVHGGIPAVGSNNILARRYRTGGGLVGNVPAGAVKELLGVVPAVQGVFNPKRAEGGADGELVESVRTRAPRTVRHRQQAISLSDYEALAREASPAVAVARVLPTTHPSGREAAGWVRVIIMPQSQDAEPQPSFELRRRVKDYLSARMPASVAGRISVTGPTYLPIGVEAAIAPLDFGLAGQVFEAAVKVLRDFLHPLTGGPEGQGWPFGRDVFLSDVAAVLEAVPGVDYVQTLNLLLENVPYGERIDVPPDRIVIAGPIRITLVERER